MRSPYYHHTIRTWTSFYAPDCILLIVGRNGAIRLDKLSNWMTCFLFIATIINVTDGEGLVVLRR